MIKYNDYLKIDKELDSYKLTYKNFELSKLLRDELIYQLNKKEKESTPKVTITKRALKRLIISMFKSIPILFIKKKIWVFSNADRRKIFNSKYIDRVGSIVSEVYPNDTLFIENHIINDIKKPSSDIILSESFLQALSLFMIFIFYNHKKIKLVGDISVLEKKYDIEIKLNGLIKKHIGQYYSMKLFLLLKKPPKVIFIVYPNGYYGYMDFFKKKKIPIIELQHGIIHLNHHSYNYNNIPNVNEFKPNYIFTYGSKDKTILEEMLFLPHNKIFSIGSYMISLQEKTIVSSYLLEILKSNTEQRKVIIISASIPDLNEMLNWASKISVINSNLLLLILPRTNIKTNFIDTTNFKILDPNLTNIYELIKCCDVHVTKNSTTCLEALFLNKKSIIYESIERTSIYRTNYDYINQLSYFTSYEEFLELINSELNNEDNNINLLFEENNVSKFKNSMRKINLGNV